MRISLLGYLKEAEDLIGIAAWSTRSVHPPSELNVEKEKITEMLKFAVEHKLSSVLDFPFYIFEIYGISRSFTHQWVRHRLASHMQQSLRYVEPSLSKLDWFVIPPEVMKDLNSIISYIEHMKNCAKVYQELRKYNIKKEDARFALPIGTKTFITTSADAEEWLHIIKLRTCKDAQWEIRTVAWTIGFILYLVHPKIFYKFGPWCIQESCKGFSIKKDSNCYKNTLKIRETLKKLADEIRDKFNNREEGKIEINNYKFKYWIEKDYFSIELTDLLGYIPPNDIREKVKKKYGIDPKFEVVARIKYL